MQQTFVKTIDGSELEFNKLLYPSRYSVLLRRPNQNPETLTIVRSEGRWVTNNMESIPVFDSLIDDIILTIEENETAAVEILD